MPLHLGHEDSTAWAGTSGMYGRGDTAFLLVLPTGGSLAQVAPDGMINRTSGTGGNRERRVRVTQPPGAVVASP